MEEIKIGFNKYILSDEHANESLQSFICTFKDKQYEYFRFEDLDSYTKFVDKCIFLKKHSICVPKLIAKSKKELIVIRELIKGDNCSKLVLNNAVSDAVFEKLFLMYKMCRVYKFDLDYMPEHYVYCGKNLYYIAIDTFKKNEQYALETYGLYFWIYSKEGLTHLKEIGYDVSKVTQLNKAESNKNVVLLTIKYW